MLVYCILSKTKFIFHRMLIFFGKISQILIKFFNNLLAITLKANKINIVFWNLKLKKVLRT